MTAAPRPPSTRAASPLDALFTARRPVHDKQAPPRGQVVAPAVCKGTFVLHESGRRRGHEYLCDTGTGEPDDVTFSASAFTSGLACAAWFTAAYGGLWLRARRGARREGHTEIRGRLD